MITAAEARELAGPTPRERAEALEGPLRQAAEQKKRRLVLRQWWSTGAQQRHQEWQGAKEILEGFGYKVSAELNAQNEHITLVEW